MKAYINHFYNHFNLSLRTLPLSRPAHRTFELTLTAVLALSLSTYISANPIEQSCHHLDPQEITLAMTEPQLYFNDIELIPEISGETPAQWLGYRVGFLRGDSWVSQFGLASGDLITAVNDAAIKDLAAFNTAIKSIPQLQQFSLSISRDTAQMQMHFLYGAQAQCPLDLGMTESHGEEA